MDSSSRETLVMKTFEDPADSGDLLGGADALSAMGDIENMDAFPLKALSSDIFHLQDLPSTPRNQEHPPLLSASPSKSSPHDLNYSRNTDTRINSSSSIEDAVRVKNCLSALKTSMEGPDFGLSNSVLNYLSPPQIGGTKLKRGPGRPRKDCLGVVKSPRLPTPKIKSLLGSVRGRKKSDLSTSLTSITSSSFNSEASGESPPRGMDDTVESDSSSVASSLEKLQDDFSMFPEVWPGKLCAFCNLGERSMLGQGDLIRQEIPESFHPASVFKTLTPKSRIERENSVDKSQKPGLFSRRQKGQNKMKRLMSQTSLESLNEPVDEVCGHQEDPEITSVFDTSGAGGFYYIHENCALWCDGVEKKADGSFANLEVEVLRALSQRCHHCCNLGAGLACKAEGCNVLLHYPCAAISGAFQDPSGQTTVCSSHVEAMYTSGNISGICTVCDARNDITALIMCSSCGRHYHGTCMALNSDPGIRAGWQCPACKICQACRQPGEESKLLPCDTCDKPYHIFCLRPQLSSIPKHSWKCKMCRMCTDCGARTPGSGPSSRWHANFSVCDSCYQQRNKGLACPLCGRAYRHVAQKLMLQCNLCKKYVHGTCDPAADLATYQQKKEIYPDYEYICIPCKASGTGLNTFGGNPKVLSTLKRSDDTDDGINHNVCATSQDSLLSLEDDSFPGTENSNDLLWLDKPLASTSMEDIKPQLPQQINLISKERPFVGMDKLHKRKLLSGRIKVGEKMGPVTTHSIGRKTKFNEFAKKRGPKPKQGLFGTSRGAISRNSTDGFIKDEEPGVENRMVLCSSRDDFVLQQDLCVMCGALGCDLEGRLISCSQCGQCYHPYCVNVKVTKVILQKGWRCLDCTVCEGCGQRNDESRLILCDECDVSFHIYCIDPPLSQVPQGSWKCKWCTVCHYCGSNSSRCGWFENYSKCGSCASQTQCPVCLVNYSENDLIIQCLKCDRWLHGACDMIKDIKDAEKCAEGNYFCILCRPMDVMPIHLRPSPKLTLSKRELPSLNSSDLMTKPSNHILMDGIYLSEHGFGHIKSITMDLPKKKRKKMSNLSDVEAGIMATIESVVAGGDKPGASLLDPEKDKDAKKRQRNLQKLGIGGFLVRLRGPRFKDEDADSLEAGDGEKPKRKPQKRKAKNKLIESFPIYLQEAFFGKPLMTSTKDVDLTTSVKDLEIISTIKSESTIKLSKEELQAMESLKPKRLVDQPSSQGLKHKVKDSAKASNAVDGMSDILTMPGDLLDHDLVNTIMNERNAIKSETEVSEGQGGSTQMHGVDDNNPKDEFSDFLSAQYLESMDSAGLPSMDSKDVEDIFKGVLVEDHSENFVPIPSNVTNQPVGRPRPSVPTTPAAAPIIPSPVAPTPPQGSPNVSRPPGVGVQQNLSSPSGFPPPSPYHSEYSNSPQFSPAFSEPPSPWPAPVEDADQPSSYNQRSILKWEADEGLGPSATISAVLYANINHPELKRDYASWAERSKQIAKIWRGLPAEKRAPYLQKARENRAAIRMQKAQQIASPEHPQPSPKSCHSPQIPANSFNETKPICSNDKPNNFNVQFPSSGYNVPSSPHAPYSGPSSGGKPDRRNQNMCTVKPASTEKSFFNDKNTFADQQIKVLTPSEIMKSLPNLGQDDCGFPSKMDQEKIVTVSTKTRVESQEERQWKQMQAQRQQSQLQESQPKDGPTTPLHSPVTFPTPSTPIMRALRPPGGEMGGSDIRQPLHLSMPHDQKGGVHSPQHQKPIGHGLRPGVPSEMAPPGQLKPMFASRVGPAGQVPRSPFTRPPSISPQPHMHSKPDSYGQLTQQEDGRFTEPDNINSGQYNQQKVPGMDSPDLGSGCRPPSSSPQGQETRQHLRDLLQRQQVKKLEDQMSPTLDPQQAPRMWSQEEWQKPGDNNQARHPLQNQGGMSPSQQNAQMNQFRQPFLPNHARFPTGLQSMNRPGDFRMNMMQSQAANQGPEMRARMMLQQQQRGMPNQPIRQPQTFHGNTTSQFNAIRNSIDPYGHLVIQQSRMQGGGIVSSSSMLAQQLGRPMTQSLQGQNPDGQSVVASQMASSGLNQQMNTQPMSDNTTSLAHLSSDHQELPESVTAELEKLEQEQHNEHNQDAEDNDLVGLGMGMDDDDLLSMGADFNILEFADPELDQDVGDKGNILDLDLEDDDKDDKEKRKESQERNIKSGDKDFSGHGQPGKQMKQQDSMDGSAATTMISSTNPNYSHVGGLDPVQSVMRPAQPPPPYPGPPPPYPGRPQIGVRNGCGMIPAAQSVMALGVGLKNPMPGFVGGGRPLFPHATPPSSMLSNSNHHLSIQQRKTLLLQEQPLLLEDLLEQEKREQLRQSSGLIGAAPEEPLLSDFDFERLKADVLSSSALPVSLSPPTVVGVVRNQPPPPVQDWQMDNQGSLRPPESSEQHMLSHPPNPALATVRLPNPIPPPPNPPEHPATEQERHMYMKYEKWLMDQQQILQIHLKYFETEVNKLRKVKKSLNSKQRQLRKNNNELNETDAAELERVVKELPGIQKQLDGARKQHRQHNLLVVDFRNKQAKRQQMMGIGMSGQGGPPAQSSPLGASSSPHHSTPQSPLMSPSPSMQPSPLTQHSPMASPLTPSPGPVGSMAQNSPRGPMNPGMHMLDDPQFSPSPDGGRMMNQGPGRMHQMPPHMRMTSPGPPGHPNMMPQQQGGMNNSPVNPGMIMTRGMVPLQQHRPMDPMQRMRSTMPQEHMRNVNPMAPRFQRMGMNPEMMMRARPPNNFGNQSPMGMAPAGHYNVSRVPFPSQSPTGSGNLRSPSPMNPMTPMGNLGSPPNQMMMSQNRVSPASSPMRRPSGSGSIGSASPMAERPLSVENPLTPRPGNSRPHTPSGSMNMEQHPHMHQSMMDVQHYSPMDNCGMGSPIPHKMNNYMTNNPPSEYQNQNQGSNDYNMSGGGGGGNSHVIPFPTFSFFDGPVKLGLKGGSPFSVVTEHTPSTSTSSIAQPPVTNNESRLVQVSGAPVNVAHPAGGSTTSSSNTSGSSSSSSNGPVASLTPVSNPNPPLVLPNKSESNQVGLPKQGIPGGNGQSQSSKDDSQIIKSSSTLPEAKINTQDTKADQQEDMSNHVGEKGEKVEMTESEDSQKTEAIVNCNHVDHSTPNDEIAESGEAKPDKTPGTGAESSSITTVPPSSTDSVSDEQGLKPVSDSEVPGVIVLSELVSEDCETGTMGSKNNSSSTSENQIPNTQMKALPSTAEDVVMTPITVATTNSIETSQTTQAITPTSPTEAQSQNALLKQLLQNTGCASTVQTSENVGFSLSSLQTKPPTVPTHTSHLSEAATRIPQPTPPPSRPPSSCNQVSGMPSAVVKMEVEDSPVPSPSPQFSQGTAAFTPMGSVPQSQEITSPTLQTIPEKSVLTPEQQIPPKLELADTELVSPIEIPLLKSLEIKKPDEEIKKVKRRQYQSKRKQAAPKEPAAISKKRPRKAGKPEEDFDSFLENFMTQLRQLPPVGIVEPDLGHSYNICPAFGAGDYGKLHVKDYDPCSGDLSGTFGLCTPKSGTDYYGTNPFGKTSALPMEKTPPSSHRGFYNQEFAAPRTTHLGSLLQDDSRTPTPLRETDTPDTIVSSSSPECTARESPDLFPCVKLIETEEDKQQHLRDSPIIQIACPIPIRPLLAARLAKRNDFDKENMKDGLGFKSRSFGLRENGNITVTLTLSSAVVDEVRIVLRNLANVLSIETPPCQIEKLYPRPDKKMFTFKAKDSDAIGLQCILNGAAKFCKHCDALVLNNVIKKRASDLLGLAASNVETPEELCFCSANCFRQFSVSHGVTPKPGEEVKQRTENRVEVKVNLKDDGRLAKNFFRQRRDWHAALSEPKAAPIFKQTPVKIESPGKKEWDDARYKMYSPSVLSPNKYKKPTEKELTEMLYRSGITVVPKSIPEDTRKCALCHQIGDGVSDGPGRLLNFDVDKWAHLNCALWSEDVYETENGALVNVEVALKQSLTVACILCKQNGASVKCFKHRCSSVYHLPCAMKDECAFYKNKSVYCNAHVLKGEKENELSSLSVIRRVYVQRDENRQVAVVMHHGDQHHLLRVGSLIFLNVGQLLPHQLQSFHTKHYIYPVGYKIVRFYWSMTKANKRCQYICAIHEADGKPEFRITAQEEDGKERMVKSSTAQGAWFQVLEDVSKVRNAQDCIKVFPKYITGEDLFGLTEPSIVKVLESLPGIETLTDYNFKYGRNPLLELPLAINPSGCARSEPKLRTHFKRSHTQRTGAYRTTFSTTVLSSSEAACPYSKQFVHSKSSQYKKMKQEWRNNVYLARSKIQGLGLYAARDIERHTMVIEYIGEIIRNELAENREKKYEAQNRGIYMFRIDDERVIDATLCGGLARYINHSCNPNCVAETVEVDRDLRIIIFANRRISRGEELAYDYKFEVEDDQHKIPCLCGAPNCQQWMN